jgi:hypothetical protein
MSDELNVVQRSQRIVVEPSSRSVSLINAGPIGPTGATGPTGPVGEAENGIPAGGEPDELLAKASGDDYDVEWVAAPAAANGIPTGGTAGQVLTKDSGTDFDTSWQAPGGGGVSDGDKGDITVSASGATWNIDAGAVGTTEIADNAVTLAKMADMASSRFLGRVTASSGDPEVLTPAQATALLDAFSSTLKGLVPLSGGGSTNFLRADGSWAAPPGTTPDHPNTPYHYLCIPFIADATANLTLTNMAAAEDYLGSSNRHITMADLTYFTHCRLVVRRMAGAAAAGSPSVSLQYATSQPSDTFTGAEWTPSGASVVITSTNTVLDSDWQSIPGGMAIDDVFLGLVMAGGDGAADPVVGSCRAYFRGPISHS